MLSSSAVPSPSAGPAGATSEIGAAEVLGGAVPVFSQTMASVWSCFFSFLFFLSIYIYIYILFPPVGFKGNLSLLETCFIYVFPRGLEQIED